MHKILVRAGKDTLTNVENILGSDFNDTLIGDAEDNVLRGAAGDDTLMGAAGDDSLSGGLGTNEVDGGSGTDTASYMDAQSGVEVSLGIQTAQNTIGAGTDTLTDIENLQGSDHDDILIGDAGSNVLTGGLGDDQLSGMGGDDILTGGAGVNELDGGTGSDTVSYENAESGVEVDLRLETAQANSGNGIDTLSDIENIKGSDFNDTFVGNMEANHMDGGAGDDSLSGGGGDDTLIGGDGSDTVSYFHENAGVTVDLSAGTGTDSRGDTDTLSEIENIEGSAFIDTLTGDDKDNIIIGGAGDDAISGLGGEDRLFGDDGNDTLLGGDDDDTLFGGAGDDTMDGGSGSDTASYNEVVVAEDDPDPEIGVTVDLKIAAAQDTVREGQDILTNVENLEGSQYNDTLVGDGHDNVLTGGEGDDLLDGDAGQDTVSYANAVEGVVVDLDRTDDQDTVGAGTDTITNMENATGSAFDDILSGNASGNVLSGGAGDDELSGLAGDDTLIGGAGGDIIDGGTGVDTASFKDADQGVSVDLTITTEQNTEGAGSDRIIHVENLEGSAYDDALTGDAGNNTIIGGAGDDLLTGGAGDDVIDGGIGENDLVSYADIEDDGTAIGVTVDLSRADAQNTVRGGMDTLSNIENIEGSHFNDTLTGDANDNAFIHVGGQNTIDGRGGSDMASYAFVEEGVFADLSNSTGPNAFVGDKDDPTSRDTLTDIENLTGSIYDDHLIGTDQNNIIEGGLGDDVLAGLAGDDTLRGGEGNDSVSYEYVADNGSNTGVTIDLTLTGAQDTVRDGQDILEDIEGVVGTDFNDTLLGSSAGNTLIGGDGDDRLEGKEGDDILDGGDGDDVLDGGSGTGDFASYADAVNYIDTDGVQVDLSLSGPQNTVLAGSDTLIGIENLEGSDFDDILHGTDSSNIIIGGKGDDTVYGGLGNDRLFGGEGNDVLYGEDGNDLILGSMGNDFLDGGAGSDAVSFEYSTVGVTVNLLTETASGDTGDADTFSGIENIYGSAFDDTLFGDDGDNIIYGGVGDDTINGLGGDDTLLGNAGDDILMGGDGQDDLKGGAGKDTASYTTVADDGSTTGVTADLSVTTFQDTIRAGLDRFSGIENLTGSDFNDSLTGDDNNNVITGGAGNDRLTGGAGNDILEGQDGVDNLIGGAGSDWASYAGAPDGVVIALDGVLLNHDGYDDTDNLTGIENIRGSDHNDTLRGNAYNNILEGGAGDDTLIGAEGSDAASYAHAGAAVTVNLQLTGPQNTGGDGTDTLVDINNVIGSEYNDTLTGNSGNNILIGGGGDDTLTGGGGSDVYAGGYGDDIYDYSGAIGSLTLLDQDHITLTENIYAAGDVTIISASGITISGDIILSTRQIAGTDHAEDPSTGDSGTITLRSKHITLTDGVQLLAHVDEGNTEDAAGNVLIEAYHTPDAAWIDDLAGNYDMDRNVWVQYGIDIFSFLNPFDSEHSSVTMDNAVVKGNQVYVEAHSGRSELFAEKTEEFDAAAAVDGTGDTIRLPMPHTFKTGDAVVYEAVDGEAIDGLKSGDVYYAVVVDFETVRLAATEQNATAETPVWIDLDPSTATGTHSLVAEPTYIPVLTDITNFLVNDLGFGFDISPVAISIASSDISLGGAEAVGGLSENTEYYVIQDGPNTIRLAATLEDAMAASPVWIELDPGNAAGIHSLLDMSANRQVFTAADVNKDDHIITFSAPHLFETGDAVHYSVDGGLTRIDAQDLSINALSMTDASVRTRYLPWMIGVGVSLPTATVTVGEGTVLDVGDKLSITTVADSNVHVSVSNAGSAIGSLADKMILSMATKAIAFKGDKGLSAWNSLPVIQLGFGLGIANASSVVEAGASITSGGTFNVQAQTIKNQHVDAAAAGGEGPFALAVPVSLFFGDAVAQVNGTATSGDDITITADVLAETDEVTAFANLGSNSLVKAFKWSGGINLLDLKTILLSENATTSSGNRTIRDLNLTGAFAIDGHFVDAVARIGDGAVVTSTSGDIIISATTSVVPKLKSENIVTSLKTQQGKETIDTRKKSAGISTTVGVYITNAEAAIGKLADVNAFGSITIQSKTQMPASSGEWGLKDLIGSGFGLQRLFFTSWAQASAEGTHYASQWTNNIFVAINSSKAYIDEGARINQDLALRSDRQDVIVDASSDIFTTNLSGVIPPIMLMQFAILTGSSSSGSGGGLNLLVHGHYNNVRAEIKKDAMVHGETVKVSADNNITSIDIGAISGKAQKKSINATLSLVGYG